VDFWQVLPVAIALLFIVEGILPFLSPARWRAMLMVAGKLDDRFVRYVGLGSMLLGVCILYWLH
jgi:uncharacterized protein